MSRAPSGTSAMCSGGNNDFVQLEGPAQHCNDYERTIKSAGDKRLILDKINSRRNKVAAGEIRSLRAAENMMTLDWNEDLAVSAQRWADQCVTHSVPDNKDTCRDLEHVSVGQNIATIYDDAPGLVPTMLVDLWYIELLNVNSSIISKYQRSPGTGSEHYDYFTQLVWAETSQVGCGAVKFKEQVETRKEIKNRTIYRLVCNFAPAGNQIGKSVYLNGLPCSRCQYNSTCDSVYKALCPQYNTSSFKSGKYKNPIKQIASISHKPHLRTAFLKVTKLYNSTFNNDPKNVTDVFSWPEQKFDSDENISFDFFTDLFELTTKSSTHYIENTTVCKEILVVDELFDLLKRKLSNDETLRQLLLTSKSSQLGNTEEMFTDPSVAEILSHIYTTKEHMTTTKTTNEYINSTLLVDLVEAVIFRNNGKYSTSSTTDLNNQSTTEVNPVKIRAELGETKHNSDFTGHYFFPEDNNDEANKDKSTDNYYDVTDLSMSDVAIEIEDLRRNKGTKDFLEEILDSDFITETVSHMYLNNIASSATNKFRSVSTITYVNFIKNGVLKKKKRSKDRIFPENHRNMKNVRKKRRLVHRFFRYSDLLRQLTVDLKMLKLKRMFHCSQNACAKKTLNSSILVIVSFVLYII